MTTFPVFGGDGPFTDAERPAMVEDRMHASLDRPVFPVSGPGKVVLEQAFENDRSSDGCWDTLGALRASQGEQVCDGAFFRLDVEGTSGNDENGFSVGASRVRDRDRPHDGLKMFSFQPTIRWTANGTATRVAFSGTSEPYTVQNLDTADGDLLVVTDYGDLPIAGSGQNFGQSIRSAATKPILR